MVGVAIGQIAIADIAVAVAVRFFKKFARRQLYPMIDIEINRS